MPVSRLDNLGIGNLGIGKIAIDTVGDYNYHNNIQKMCQDKFALFRDRESAPRTPTRPEKVKLISIKAGRPLHGTLQEQVKQAIGIEAMIKLSLHTTFADD